MIYECTDCEHCANFHSGFRLFCLHPNLKPASVCGYYPVGDGDAIFCVGFDDIGVTHRFPWAQLTEAENYSKEKYGDICYEGIREWCLERLEEISDEPARKT